MFTCVDVYIFTNSSSTAENGERRYTLYVQVYNVVYHIHNIHKIALLFSCQGRKRNSNLSLISTLELCISICLVSCYWYTGIL